jgi:hypothetical protein
VPPDPDDPGLPMTDEDKALVASSPAIQEARAIWLAELEEDTAKWEEQVLQTMQAQDQAAVNPSQDPVPQPDDASTIRPQRERKPPYARNRQSPR